MITLNCSASLDNRALTTPLESKLREHPGLKHLSILIGPSPRQVPAAPSEGPASAVTTANQAALAALASGVPMAPEEQTVATASAV